MKIPVPGIRKPIGLGEVVKNFIRAAGVEPCGGCAKRAERLNKIKLVSAEEWRHKRV